MRVSASQQNKASHYLSRITLCKLFFLVFHKPPLCFYVICVSLISVHYTRFYIYPTYLWNSTILFKILFRNMVQAPVIDFCHKWYKFLKNKDKNEHRTKLTELQAIHKGQTKKTPTGLTETWHSRCFCWIVWVEERKSWDAFVPTFHSYFVGEMQPSNGTTIFGSGVQNWSSKKAIIHGK